MRYKVNITTYKGNKIERSVLYAKSIREDRSGYTLVDMYGVKRRFRLIQVTDFSQCRTTILPDSKDGMLYQPCVLNPHKVYDTLWNFIAKQFPQAKPDMIKHDNKILNASKTVQDEFVLSGIRW